MGGMSKSAPPGLGTGAWTKSPYTANTVRQNTSGKPIYAGGYSTTSGTPLSFGISSDNVTFEWVNFFGGSQMWLGGIVPHGWYYKIWQVSGSGGSISEMWELK